MLCRPSKTTDLPFIYSMFATSVVGEDEGSPMPNDFLYTILGVFSELVVIS